MLTHLAVVRTSALAALVGLASCGGEDFEAQPVDVEGQYSVALTNQTNGCGFGDWAEGTVTQNVSVVIAQDGEALSATVEGLSGLVLGFALGTNEFHGALEGSTMSLEAKGTLPHDRDGCTTTWNATLEAEVDANTLEGTIVYSAPENTKPECAELAGCTSVQRIAGARPPKS